MINQELQNKIKRLLPLVNSRFMLAETLSDSGLECYKVSDNLVRALCESTDNYEKEREFLVEWKKLKVSHGTYKRQYFLDLQTKAGEHADKYDKPWLLALTTSSKAIAKCDFLKTPQCQKRINSYHAEFDKAWGIESTRFSTQEIEKYDFLSDRDMTSLIDKVCVECFESLGFYKSEKYIKTGRNLYLKHLHDEWFFYMIFDLHNIKQGMNFLESFFGLVKINKKTKDILNPNTVRSSFEYNDFISLNDAEIGHYLKSFNSSRQLEAIIRINAFLYQLVVELGFERVLSKH